MNYRSILLLIVLIITLIPHNSINISQIKTTNTNRVILKVPAVQITENGSEVGVLSDLIIEIKYPGTGTVYFSAEPLTELDTQATARVATLVASYLADVNWNDYDFYIKLKAPTLIVGGPSAGVAITVGILAAILGDSIKGDVIATGMINPDGTIGPVGGIVAKLKAAAEYGAKLFLIPAGQSTVYQTIVETTSIGGIIIRNVKRVPVNVMEEGKKLGVQVVEVASVREAYYYFTNRKLEPKKINPMTPQWMLEFLREWTRYNVDNASILINQVNSLIENLNPNARIYIEEIVNNVNNSLKKIKDYLKDGKAYTAASLSFMSVVKSEYAKVAAEYLSGKRPHQIVSNLIKQANDTLTLVDKRLRTIDVKRISDLELFIASIDRKYEALDVIKRTSVLLDKGIILDDEIWGALHEAVYAKWRAITALQWSSVIPHAPLSPKISKSRLFKVTSLMIYESESVLGYLKTLYKDLGLNINLEDLENMYNNALQAYRNNNTYIALTFSLKTIIQSTLIIHNLFQSNINLIINATKIEALDALSKLINRGIDPVLPQSYFELAENQKTNNIKLQLYELSSIYSKILYQIVMPTNLGNITHTPSNIITVTKTKTKTITKTIYNNPRLYNLYFILVFILIIILIILIVIIIIIRSRYLSS